jgi:hypothetical protein
VSIGEIDAEPYAVSEAEQSLLLTSETNGYLGCIVEKRFAPAESSSGTLGIAVTYTIQNENSVSFGYAPWEISRVASGTVVYPSGPGGQLAQSTLTLQDALDHSWYTYDAEGLEDVPKVFADGSDGWLAWAQAGSPGALVIKSFEDISSAQFAEGEAEIEVYADPSGDYMEVEQQGAFEEIAPGARLTWTVVWLGVPVDSSVTVEVGSQGLINLIESTL